MIEVYTDGACSRNGYDNARAGWGAIGIYNGEMEFEVGGIIFEEPTNQKAELAACFYGLELAHTSDLSKNGVIIYSDSAYLINCVKDKWWVNWEKNGWKNAKGQPVANKRLWEKLIPYFKKDNISFVKVKGHSGNVWNEKVDILAKSFVSK